MKMFLVLFFILFYNNSFAKYCEYDWETSLSGISVGMIHDRVDYTDSKIIFTSNIIPNKIASTLGAGRIDRKTTFLKDFTFYEKEEKNFKDNKIYHFLKNGNIVTINKSSEIKINEDPILDTISIPYLLLISPNIALKNEISVNFLFKDKIVNNLKTTISSSEIYLEHKKWKVSISYSDKLPQKITINDGKLTLTSKLIKHHCN